MANAKTEQNKIAQNTNVRQPYWREKPFLAIATTLFGGFLIFGISLLGILIIAPLTSSAQSTLTLEQLCSGQGINLTQNFTASLSTCITGTETAYGTGMLAGAIVILAGISMNSYDAKKVNKMGAIALAFSLASAFSGGGAIIGLILGFCGGILGIIYKG
jgi:hypothetical protein